jgi:large-conductance mechanosensitive channel
LILWYNIYEIILIILNFFLLAKIFYIIFKTIDVKCKKITSNIIEKESKKDKYINKGIREAITRQLHFLII